MTVAPADTALDIWAYVKALERRIEQLEARPSRDAADAELRQQLATSTQALPFRSKDLFAHGGVDPALRRALVRADCCDVEAIGLWLRRERGSRDGVRIERDGRKWRAMHVEHVTCTDPIG